MSTLITKADDLVTTHEQTRKGFIEAALEKNRRAKPYIENAKTLRTFAMKAKTPRDLLNIPQIRKGLLTASGLSVKALNHFTENDKVVAIKELIDQFLIPAGDSFVDELVYRFLLISGDSLGGTMRNVVGAIAQMKLVRQLLSVMEMRQVKYYILKKDDKARIRWSSLSYDDAFDSADEIAAIRWQYNGVTKVLFFNTKIPLVNNNIDICLYDCTTIPFSTVLIRHHNECAIMFGELKGGIDPAGADEHWKTGNSALGRIRTAFNSQNFKIHTSFIGAAIEKKMATEIFAQIQSNTLSYAINLTYDNQLSEYCEWLITLEKKQ